MFWLLVLLALLFGNYTIIIITEKFKKDHFAITVPLILHHQRRPCIRPNRQQHHSQLHHQQKTMQMYYILCSFVHVHWYWYYPAVAHLIYNMEWDEFSVFRMNEILTRFAKYCLVRIRKQHGTGLYSFVKYDICIST